MGIETGAIGCAIILIGALIVFTNYILFLILRYYDIDKFKAHKIINIIGGVLCVIGLAMLILYYII